MSNRRGAFAGRLFLIVVPGLLGLLALLPLPGVVPAWAATQTPGPISPPAEPTPVPPVVISPTLTSAVWQVVPELGDRFQRLAAGPAGEVWAIGADGLFQLADLAWNRFPLPPELAAKIESDPWFLTDFVVGADETAWVSTGQEGIYRFAAGAWTWYSPAGGWPYQGALRLAVGSQGQLLAVVRAGETRLLVLFDGQSWQELAWPESLDDLSGAAGLALGLDGEIWLAVHDRAPYHRDGRGWYQATNGWFGDSRDIALAGGAGGQVWVGNSAGWFRWTGQGWQNGRTRIPAPFSYPVAVDGLGGAWGIVHTNCYWCKIPNLNENGAVYVSPDRACRFTAADGLGGAPLDPLPEPFDYETPRPDQVRDIAVAGDGRAWFVTQGRLTVFSPTGPVCDAAGPANIRTPQAADLSQCDRQPDYFAGLWQERLADMGCPVTGPAGPVQMAEQQFEGGWMLWRGDTATIFALPFGQLAREFDDSWAEGQPAYSCPELGPAQTPPIPQRGFGQVWCAEPDLRQRLGQATAQERGFSAQLQVFERGLIFANDLGATYILKGFGPGWERLE